MKAHHGTASSSDVQKAAASLPALPQRGVPGRVLLVLGAGGGGGGERGGVSAARVAEGGRGVKHIVLDRVCIE